MTPIDPLAVLKESMSELPAHPADADADDVERFTVIEHEIGELIDVIVQKAGTVAQTIALGAKGDPHVEGQLASCEQALDALARYRRGMATAQHIDRTQAGTRTGMSRPAAKRQMKVKLINPDDPMELPIEIPIAAGEAERDLEPLYGCSTVELESGMAKYRSGGIVGKVASDLRGAAFSEPLFNLILRAWIKNISSVVAVNSARSARGARACGRVSWHVKSP